MDSEEQVVYSAGNSWIVCKSKSHTGRTYYFNTLTGEAAWNLSDAEIEKAKKTTNSLQKQNSINTQEWPEPKGPPMDQTKKISAPSTQKPGPSLSKVYNKQIINNQFSKQSYPIAPFIVPPYGHLVTNPINSILPVAVNTSSTSAFNTNVWSTHPIYLGPTIPPFVNQGQDSENQPYNSCNEKHTVTVQNTSSTLSGRFQNLSNKRSNFTPRRQFQRRTNFTPTRDYNKFRHRNIGVTNNFKKNLGVDDLREFLSARKQRRVSFEAGIVADQGLQSEKCHMKNEHPVYDSDIGEESDIGEQSAYESEPEGENVGKQKDNNNRPNDGDSDWLEENILVEDCRLKLDVSNLKKMAKPEMDPVCWYIVADKDVLLHHLNFLNILCNSDENCLLMIAQQVMAELHEVSRGTGPPRVRARARRAVSLLLQQLDAGYVVIGDGTCKENDTRCDYLLNCCMNIYEQNYHVVLLSNDDEFKEYKIKTNIPIFNIREIKQFLTKSVPEEVSDKPKTPPYKEPEIQKTERLKEPPCVIKTVPQCTTAPLKITLTNNLLQKTNANLTPCEVTKGTQINDDFEAMERCVDGEPAENEEDNHINKTGSPIKYTVEAGVQTELHIEEENSVSDNYAFIYPQISRSQVFEKTPEDEKEINKKVTSTTFTQSVRREIRLNRSISVNRSASIEDTGVEKKQFKWRRKRRVSSTITSDSKLASADNSNIDENSADYINTQRNDKLEAVSEQQLLQNKSAESISSETSSLLITRNVINGTLTVEETSTSGIISNSTSNVDSESESGFKTAKFGNKQRGSQKMFEITDQRMEDCLRMMNDEWVSRFIQIMEEVLTQVLRKDENFLYNVVYKLHGGGPWTIREAADCIKIKFNDNCDIVHAASKLNDIFVKISDRTGRITYNLRPSDFMEMYSFGVYLVDSLQSVVKDCEDLDTASNSLLSLLSDIRNPSFDTSHNETFDTHQQDDVSFPNHNIDASHNETFDTHPQEDVSCPNHSFDATHNETFDTHPQEDVSCPNHSFDATHNETFDTHPQEDVSCPNHSFDATHNETFDTYPQEDVSCLNHSFDASHNETFDTLPQEDGRPNIDHVPSPAAKDQQVEHTTPTKQIIRRAEEASSASKSRTYNLRSKRKSVSKDNDSGENTKKIKPLKNTDTKKSFLTSLNLVKKSDESSSSPQLAKTNSPSKAISNDQSNSPSKAISNDQSFLPSLELVKKSGQIRSSPRLAKTCSPQKNKTGESISSPKLSKTYSPTKNKTGESISSPRLSKTYSPTKNKTGESISSPRLSKTITPSKNKTGESISSPRLSKTITPSKAISIDPEVASNSQDLRSAFNPNQDESGKDETTATNFLTTYPDHEEYFNKTVEREPLDMDQLDYSAINDDDYINEQYYQTTNQYYENENDSLLNNTDTSKGQNYLENENGLPQDVPVIRTDDSAYFKIDNEKFVRDSPLSINNNLNCIFSMIVRRVKDTFLDVQTFCKETHKELSESPTLKRRYEINENAERAQVLLDNLCKSLNSIFYRETYEPEKNIQSLLKDAGINDFDLNDNQLKLYRDMVGQCLEQAQILQESVALIVTVIKKKQIE